MNATPKLPDPIEDIRAERERQITEEGWTPDHDDHHDDGALAKAASCYAMCAGVGLAVSAGGETHYAFPSSGYRNATCPKPLWPWQVKWWKPKDPRRDLVRAGALIVAEIERIDRAAAHAERLAFREGSAADVR